MLALVKKPRIELFIQGEHIRELIDWIKQKFGVSILSSDPEERLAEKLNVRQNMISDYERGTRRLSLSMQLNV